MCAKHAVHNPKFEKMELFSEWVSEWVGGWVGEFNGLSWTADSDDL